MSKICLDFTGLNLAVLLPSGLFLEIVVGFPVLLLDNPSWISFAPEQSCSEILEESY